MVGLLIKIGCFVNKVKYSFSVKGSQSELVNTRRKVNLTDHSPSVRIPCQRYLMKQCTLKNANNCLNTNIYSYLETSGGKIYNLYLNVVHFFNTSVN
jgi:hypothetical protein